MARPDANTGSIANLYETLRIQRITIEPSVRDALVIATSIACGYGVPASVPHFVAGISSYPYDDASLALGRAGFSEIDIWERLKAEADANVDKGNHHSELADSLSSAIIKGAVKANESGLRVLTLIGILEAALEENSLGLGLPDQTTQRLKDEIGQQRAVDRLSTDPRILVDPALPLEFRKWAAQFMSSSHWIIQSEVKKEKAGK